jgi:uncharacterized SAM-binding protein YcdF (DUF218 family)
VALAVVAGLAASTARMFVWPEVGRAERADALVILGPGRNGERYREALHLIRRNVARAIVVSESSRPSRWPIQQALCARAAAVCFRAEPSTTRGEARSTARIAKAHRWGSLIVVTSTFHVTRARLLFRRCFGGSVTVVAAGTGGGRVSLARPIVHEWGGLLNALIRERSC